MCLMSSAGCGCFTHERQERNIFLPQIGRIWVWIFMANRIMVHYDDLMMIQASSWGNCLRRCLGVDADEPPPPHHPMDSFLRHLRGGVCFLCLPRRKLITHPRGELETEID